MIFKSFFGYMKNSRQILLWLCVILSIPQVFGQNRIVENRDVENFYINTPGLSEVSERLGENGSPKEFKHWRATSMSDHTLVSTITLWGSANANVGSLIVDPNEDSGEFFAELNPINKNRIYQPIYLRNGETIDYSFWHRGKDGLGSMKFVIMDEATGNELYTIAEATTDETAWVKYTASFSSYFANRELFDWIC